MSSAQLTSRIPLVRAIFIALPLLLALTLAFIGIDAVRGFISDLVQAAAALLAAWVVTRAAQRLRREGNESARSWLFIAAAQWFFAGGMVAFMVAGLLSTEPPYPGPPDALFILVYPIMIIGLVYLPREQTSRAECWNSILDLGAFALVAALFIWHFNLRLLLPDALEHFEAGVVVSLAYTLLDVLLLFALIYRLVQRLGRGLQFGAILMLVVGGFFLIAADLLQGYIASEADFYSGSPVDLGWVMFSVMSGFAGLHLLGTKEPKQTAASGEFLRTIWTVSITYFWIVMVFAMLIWAIFADEEVNTGLLIAGAVGATVLSITRQYRSMRENADLYERLHSAHGELEQRVRERTKELQTQTELLRVSEQKFRLIVETTREWIWAMDINGTFTYCNPAVTRILGYSVDEFMREQRNLMHVEDRVLFSSDLKEKLRTKEGWVGRITRWRHRNGTYRFLEGNAAPIFDDSEHIIGYRGADRDVTKRILAEEASREHQDRYHALFESANDAIFLMKDDRIVDCNPRTLRLFGCADRGEIVGHAPDEFSPPTQPDGGESRALVLEKVMLAKTGQPLRFSWLHQRKDGTLFPTEVSLNKIEVQREEFFLAIVRDLTDVKQIEERLHRSQRLEAIGHLAGGVAHDFNNLLVPILAYSEMLLPKVEPGSREERGLKQIYEAAMRAKRLTQQLLAFGRKTVLEVSTVDLNDLIHNFERLLTKLLREDIELRLQLMPNAGNVNVDMFQIEQVIMNLVVNARDAMPDGGSVTITTDTVMLDQEFCSMHQGGNAGRYCLISVKDTGTGMNAEVQSRLFEPFFTTKEVGRGTGLGLSTVFGIVRQHGGIVTVESALGKGSTFSVFLPQAEEDRSRHRNALETKLDIHGTETILVVEDDAMVRELAVLVLQLNGYQTLSATLPSEAFALFAEHRNKIALILSDVIMPEMSGQQMYKQMAKDDPTLKVIFMSGYSGETISVHGLIEADAPMISKPFTARALLEKVRIVLDANPCPPQ